MAVAFDTLQFVRKLTQAGLSEAQAEVFANVHRDAFKEALDSNLATKADIARLKESVSSQIAELRSEMVEFKETIRSEFAEFKESIMAEINQLKRRDDYLQGQISHLKWIMIFNLGFTVTIMLTVFS